MGFKADLYSLKNDMRDERCFIRLNKRASKLG